MPEDRFQWRGELDNDALNALHAEAFEHPVLGDDWVSQVRAHSLGWVTAHRGEELIGFVNVAWDGGVHAFLIDTIVSLGARHRGIGTRMVAIAGERAREAGCEWLHVDFDPEPRAFYIEACEFEPTPGGLLALRR